MNAEQQETLSVLKARLYARQIECENCVQKACMQCASIDWELPEAIERLEREAAA